MTQPEPGTGSFSSFQSGRGATRTVQGFVGDGGGGKGGTETKAAVLEEGPVDDDRELKPGLHPLKVSPIFFLFFSTGIGEVVSGNFDSF